MKTESLLPVCSEGHKSIPAPGAGVVACGAETGSDAQLMGAVLIVAVVAMAVFLAKKIFKK